MLGTGTDSDPKGMELMTTARTAHCPQHERQVGICPACQRARLAAEKQQLAEVRALDVLADSRAGGTPTDHRWDIAASR